MTVPLFPSTPQKFWHYFVFSVRRKIKCNGKQKRNGRRKKKKENDLPSRIGPLRKTGTSHQRQLRTPTHASSVLEGRLTMFAKTIDLTGNVEVVGAYVCSSCNDVLFEATKKFDYGCGFPSFWKHAADRVKLHPLHTYNRSRIQLLCAGCGAHLGHLFRHKHTPTGLRYCVNGAAIKFQPDEPL